MRTKLFRHVNLARTTLSMTITFGVLGAIALIVQMNILSKIVVQVFLEHNNLHSIFPLLLLLFIAILVRASLLWGRERTAQQGAIRVKSVLRRRLFAHLLQLGPAYARGERTGELVVTASEGIERLDAYFSRYLPQMVLSVVVPLLVVADIFPFDWLSGVLLLVTAPIIPLLMVLVGSYSERHMQNQWTALSRMGAHFLDSVQGLTTLKLFGRSERERERERVIAVSDSFRKQTLKVLRIAFLSGMVLEFMIAFAIALIAVTLGIRLLDNSIHFEQAFLILLLAPEFYRPLRDLGTQRHAGMDGKIASERICEILDTPIPVSASDSTSGVHTSQLSLEIKQLGFTYPESDRPALQHINLRLEPHTCTALVGRSGAGKSTLINLLLRFHEITEGTIQVNGLPFANFPVEVWREQVSFVPQRPHLFYGSVRDNILLARPQASDNEIVEAATLAGAAGFIAQLPQGYATLLGERGARLSAGQIQRLALARAFLKDAPLLILDEPTSNLDPQSELLIRQALKRLLANRSVLVIAHRLNTIALADQIAVLEDGQLVEVGPAADLLQQQGAYARLMSAYRRKEVAV